jgi:hypothetical protein
MIDDIHKNVWVKGVHTESGQMAPELHGAHFKK